MYLVQNSIVQHIDVFAFRSSSDDLLSLLRQGMGVEDADNEKLNF